MPRLPGPQQLAWLVLRAEDPELAAEDRARWECLCRHEELAWVQTMVARFSTMVRERDAEAFSAWLDDCRASPTPELRNFAASLERDGAAVRAALCLPWSTGPVEGLINKLKLTRAQRLRADAGRPAAPAGAPRRLRPSGHRGVPQRGKGRASAPPASPLAPSWSAPAGVVGKAPPGP